MQMLVIFLFSYFRKITIFRIYIWFAHFIIKNIAFKICRRTYYSVTPNPNSICKKTMILSENIYKECSNWKTFKSMIPWLSKNIIPILLKKAKKIPLFKNIWSKKNKSYKNIKSKKYIYNLYHIKYFYIYIVLYILCLCIYIYCYNHVKKECKWIIIYIYLL